MHTWKSSASSLLLQNSYPSSVFPSFSLFHCRGEYFFFFFLFSVLSCLHGSICKVQAKYELLLTIYFKHNVINSKRTINGRLNYACSSLLIAMALRRRRPTSCNMSPTRQHESSRTHASSTGDSLISGEVSYTGWTLSTGFGSESASRCSDVCTRWLLDTCRPAANANPSPAFLVVATCDRLTVVISTSHV